MILIVIWMNRCLILDPWGHQSALETNVIIWRELVTPRNYMVMGNCTQLYCHEQVCVLKTDTHLI